MASPASRFTVSVGHTIIIIIILVQISDSYVWLPLLSMVMGMVDCGLVRKPTNTQLSTPLTQSAAAKRNIRKIKFRNISHYVRPRIII